MDRERTEMKKNNWMFWTDLGLFLSFLGVVLTASVMEFALEAEEGTPAGEMARTFLGMGRECWGDTHVFFGVALALFGILHIVLRWGMFSTAVRNRFSRPEI
jgi:hypothetical protein